MDTMMHYAKIAGGSVLCLIALGTALVSLILNFRFGLESGVLAAIILLLAEVGRFSIPAVATLMGWHRLLVTAIVLCGSVSLFSAITQWMDADATHLLSASTANADNDRAKAEYARISSQLADLKVKGTVADLEALAKAHKDKATAEAGRGFCGKFCAKAEADYAATLADLAPARQKEKLEAGLVAAKAELAQAKPVVASGTALVLSAITGWNQDKVAMGLSVVKTGLIIALLESLVYLGILGFPLLVSGLRGLYGIEEPVEVEPSVVLLKPLAGRKEETLERLLALCLRNPEGCITASGHYLSKTLGVANSTLAKWLKSWAEEGRLVIEPVNAHRSRYRAA
jgi:hypothetical protein